MKFEQIYSVQDWLPFEKILENGIIKLKDSSYIKILKVKPINYNLKSELEKEAILNSYKNFIKSCNFNLQILIQSKKEDLSKENYLPILSNDEMGDIAFNYNHIQMKLAKQQDIMLKQEQLSVLGEMAGGMAHDINTPISAINTAITMLSKKTTDEREQAILKNMQISTDRIISIVTSMRNQVRNMGSNEKENFSLNVMASDLNIIVQNELKKSGCTFTVDIKEETADKEEWEEETQWQSRS